ncbi:MAG: tRNA (adenosine(37)-N6)-dimethylallyltransferase MiaA [Chitinophagaceae bacterium]
MNQTIVIVAGPTAVGKTALAIELAEYFHTSIISADSRQCFKELNIGVAKPSPEELQKVNHFFIDSHSIEEDVTAAVYESYALKVAEDLFQDNDIVIVTGGTGLYLKALCEGLDEIPAVDEGVREQLIVAYKEAGIEWLQNELKAKDPLYASEGEMQNPQRMLRALEVVLSTGQSIFSFRKTLPKYRPFTIIKTALDLPREELYERINHRVDHMMEQGLLQEVQSLIPYRHLNSLQTVGYRELFDYFDSETSLEEAVRLIKQNTRHYAKRQLTWFRKDKEIHWFHPEQKEELIRFIETQRSK